MSLRNLSLWNSYIQQNTFLKTARARITFIIAVFIVCYLIIAIRLIQIYVNNYQNTIASCRESFNRTIRADIVDRNGHILATDILSFLFYADATMVLDPEETAKNICTIFKDLRYQRVLQILKSEKKYIKLKENLSPQQKREIEELGLPGLYFKKELTRVYPHGPVCGHILGFCDETGKGKCGIEKFFNIQLAKHSEPVQLSIDINVQESVRSILAKNIDKFHARGGNVLIMNQYGEIITAVSLPDYTGDSNDSNKIYNTFNRNFQGRFEAGSVFKIINVAIALETKTASLNSYYDVRYPYRIGRFAIKDTKPVFGKISLTEAFTKSSNIASILIQEGFGPKVQRHYFEKLGLLKKMPIELQEMAGATFPAVWNSTSAKTISYGYGVAEPPCALLTALSTVINNGLPIQPTLLKRSQEAIDAIRKRRKKGTSRVISKPVSKTIRKLMRLVVKEGTGRSFNIEGLHIIGKTGSAEIVKNGHYDKNSRNATVVCAIMSGKKRYFILVMLENPQPIPGTYGFATAGWNAGPTTREIIEAIAPQLGLTYKGTANKE